MKRNPTILSCLFVASFAIAVPARAQSTTPLEEVRAALKADDLPKAEALLAPLTGPDAKDGAAFYALGQLRLKQKHGKEAAAAYEQATKLDPTNPDYFSMLGIALGQRMNEAGMMQQAVFAGKMRRAFEKSIALDPKHVRGLVGLARYFSNAPAIAGGSFEKAAEYARRVEAINPELGKQELARIAEMKRKAAADGQD